MTEPTGVMKLWVDKVEKPLIASIKSHVETAKSEAARVGKAKAAEAGQYLTAKATERLNSREFNPIITKHK